MTLKERIIQALQNPGIPDLKFLYSSQVLDIAQEFLEELLEKEKRDFEKKLETEDSEISFELFDEFSLLDYLFGLLDHYNSVNNDEKIREIIESFEPKYIDFGNDVAYSQRYYEMLKMCLSSIALTPDLSQREKEIKSEQIRILERSIENYELRGIHLGEEKQERLKEISKQLSELSQKFSNNTLDSEKEFEYIMKDGESISDMPQDDKDTALKRYSKKYKDENEYYLFDASIGSYLAVIKYCSESEVRKHFYESRQQFGALDPYDNREYIIKILALRQEKAQLLGYKNYGELSLQKKMADSPEQIVDLFSEISEKAKEKAEAEKREIEEYFGLQLTDGEGGDKNSGINVWDVSYYSRILKGEKYNLDEAELKKYFRFEEVQKYIFTVAQRLFGVEMKPVEYDCYHEDIQMFEVYREGKFLSYFMTDYFYRPTKRSGAWANMLREKDQEKKKLVVNCCNFQKGTDSLTLLPLSEVETMFHEFGHALHEMLSDTHYNDLSGFHVEWDFIELPSQLFENWCRAPGCLKEYAKHHETGAQIPDTMINALKKLEFFGTGNFIIQQNIYAMIDMMLHTSIQDFDKSSIDNFVESIYQERSLYNVGEHFYPHTSFHHIFDGGYAAGYYSYMWAEIIEKEVWKSFQESGDIFSPEISEKLYSSIYAPGSSKKASELFHDFTGREPDISAFLQDKGLLHS